MHPAFRALIPKRFHPAMRRLLGLGGVQWLRVVMNAEIEKFVRSLDCAKIDALEISGTASQERYPFRSYRAVHYPEYDVCEKPLAAEQFDLVIAEQVFEHILRPDLAAKNIHAMLRPGGYFVVNTPFLVKIHEFPVDMYRWTEPGLRQLLEVAGFNVLGTGSWGNRKCVLANMNPGPTWKSYNRYFHSLRNEPQFALVVWAFAQKAAVARRHG
ncbi:MAG: methyltransferase domain-containing protein [Candidatus Acidiferrum sp.]